MQSNHETDSEDEQLNEIKMTIAGGFAAIKEFVALFDVYRTKKYNVDVEYSLRTGLQPIINSAVYHTYENDLKNISMYAIDYYYYRDVVLPFFNLVAKIEFLVVEPEAKLEKDIRESLKAMQHYILVVIDALENDLEDVRALWSSVKSVDEASTIISAINNILCNQIINRLEELGKISVVAAEKDIIRNLIGILKQLSMSSAQIFEDFNHSLMRINKISDPAQFVKAANTVISEFVFKNKDILKLSTPEDEKTERPSRTQTVSVRTKLDAKYTSDAKIYLESAFAAVLEFVRVAGDQKEDVRRIKNLDLTGIEDIKNTYSPIQIQQISAQISELSNMSEVTDFYTLTAKSFLHNVLKSIGDILADDITITDDQMVALEKLHAIIKSEMTSISILLNAGLANTATASQSALFNKSAQQTTEPPSPDDIVDYDSTRRSDKSV